MGSSQKSGSLRAVSVSVRPAWVGSDQAPLSLDLLAGVFWFPPAKKFSSGKSLHVTIQEKTRLPQSLCSCHASECFRSKTGPFFCQPLFFPTQKGFVAGMEGRWPFHHSIRQGLVVLPSRPCRQNWNWSVG